MKKVWKLVVAAVVAVCLTACVGVNPLAEKKLDGVVGDKLSNMFFDWTVNSAESASEYEGYAAADGYQLVVCNVTIDNTFGEALPMFDTDFQLQWGEGEEDYAWSLDAYADTMMPLEWELADGESASYDLVFEVPADLTSFGIVYLEQYTDEDGNSGEGDLFTVQFEV
ncbi:DUF4352 domain-containing protein [uncultured Ruthenibacterium sp.]|uniref:DUF4352 domain-containing protein n=1 Tax=uncultured Ruthenibacterium sp. TaxID=1905347 RepID=UPI00349E9D7B